MSEAVETTHTEEALGLADTCFLVMTRFCWGTGETLDEAKKKAKQAGGDLRSHNAYIVPKGTTVDGYSRLAGI
jgi:hypothetical protein